MDDINWKLDEHKEVIVQNEENEGMLDEMFIFIREKLFIFMWGNNDLLEDEMEEVLLQVQLIMDEERQILD